MTLLDGATTEVAVGGTARRLLLAFVSASVLAVTSHPAAAAEITVFAQHVRDLSPGNDWAFPGRARYSAPVSGECGSTTTCCSTNPVTGSPYYLEANGWDPVVIPSNHRIARVEAYVRVGYSIAAANNQVNLRVDWTGLVGGPVVLSAVTLANNDNCQWLYWDLNTIRTDWGSSGSVFADDAFLLAVRRRSTTDPSNVCRVDAFKLVITTEPCLPAPGAPTVTASCDGYSENISWSAVGGATSYNVYRAGALLSNTTLTYLNYVTAACGNDCYEVAAVGPCGEGPRSGATCVSRPPAPAPTAFTLESLCGAIRLRWSGPVCGYYRVYRDGVPVASTSSMMYVDENPGASAHCYWVTRITGCTNPPTPTLCGAGGVLMPPSAVRESHP